MTGTGLEADYSPDAVAGAHDRFVVISGCSGGGKSTLLEALAGRGFQTVAEPGRQIVKEQTAIGGPALPANDALLFGEHCIARTMNRMIEAANATDYVFFDRSLIDPISGLERLKRDVPAHWTRAAEIFRFNQIVFLVPPWPEIFANDAERTHSFDDALAEYKILPPIYERFGYRPLIVPRATTGGCADFVLRTLRSHRQQYLADVLA